MRMLVIDAYYILRRLAARPSPAGESRPGETLVRAAAETFVRASAAIAPSHGLVAMSGCSGSWRRELYPAFRSSMADTEALMRDSLDAVREAAAAVRLKLAVVDDIDNLDLIALTLAEWVRGRRRASDAVILTGDPVMMQFRATGALIKSPFRDEVYDDAYLDRVFGISAPLVADLHALAGVSADNIPGVPGMGIKRAGALLREFGGFEMLLGSAWSVPGALGASLRAHREQAYVCRKLVSPRLELPAAYRRQLSEVRAHGGNRG